MNKELQKRWKRSGNTFRCISSFISSVVKILCCVSAVQYIYFAFCNLYVGEYF